MQYLAHSVRAEFWLFALASRIDIFVDMWSHFHLAPFLTCGIAVARLLKAWVGEGVNDYFVLGLTGSTSIMFLPFSVRIHI